MRLPDRFTVHAVQLLADDGWNQLVPALPDLDEDPIATDLVPAHGEGAQEGFDMKRVAVDDRPVEVEDHPAQCHRPG
jgi:hypothetical protein